jgi:hypothetical protein
MVKMKKPGFQNGAVFKLTTFELAGEKSPCEARVRGLAPGW